MKKVLFFALAAGVALAACTKNEVRPVNVDQEITFKTISTKADPAVAYADTNTFRSWAYLHDADYAENISNQLYLGGTTGLEISYKDNEWRNADAKYYWPKNGQLSFYSYGLNKRSNSLTTGAISCTFKEGIKVVGYDIVDNLNVDFLVADVAMNKTANVNTYGHSGVPTLFRHKLSNVAFTIHAKEAYANKTFELQSITLKNVTKVANYIQAPFSPSTEGWTDPSSSTTDITFCGVTPFTSDVVTPKAKQSYYIPQTFSDEQTVVLKYKIITDNGESDSSKHAVENVVVEKKLKELFPNSWEMGKKYSCAITVSLNQILWDPAVQPWVEENKTLDI